MTGSWRLAVFSKRLFVVALAFLAIPLLAEFNTRLAVSRQLFEEEARLQREIDTERDRAQFLARFQLYVQTDAYAEWWARSTRMTKLGEIAVVPVLPSSQEALVGLPGSPQDQPRDFASEWWAAFFASVP